MNGALWTEADIGDLHGRCALVTGANSGIGWETARALAAHGCRVLLGCRDPRRADEARRRILEEVSASADVAVVVVDLASLTSIQVAAASVAAAEPRLDLLINNAGVMALPRRETVDGFEMQFGVNHLGHFALTGRLLPLLLKTGHSRIVTVSSQAHKIGRVDFDNLHGAITYGRWRQYGLSKVANLLFTYQLQRKLSAAHVDTIAVACHPGSAATNLAHDAGLLARVPEWITSRFTQPASMGALPTLRAATDPDVEGAQFYGPSKGFAGFPVEVRSNAYSHDTAVARRLWWTSEELTGVSYRFG